VPDRPFLRLLDVPLAQRADERKLEPDDRDRQDVAEREQEQDP
jgi:hypothetical protein